MTLFGYLNVKCSLKAQLFEHLVPRQQSCLEELWKFQEMEPCWRKGVTGARTEVVYPGLISCFLLFSNCDYCDQLISWSSKNAFPVLINCTPQTVSKTKLFPHWVALIRYFIRVIRKKKQLWVILESIPKDFMLLFYFFLFCFVVWDIFMLLGCFSFTM